VHVVAEHRAADEARALLDREVALARAARAADRTDRWMRDHGSADAPSGEDRAT
jgi:hypothetical protein